MRHLILAASGLGLALAAPSSAAAEPQNLAPFIKEQAPEGISKELVDKLIVDLPAGRGFQPSENVTAQALIMLAECAPWIDAEDHLQVEVFAQGFVAVLMRNEAGDRLSGKGFDTGRIDALFTPHLLTMPLDDLNFTTLRLPPEIQQEARDLGQAAIAETGLPAQTAQALFVTYMIGLVGDIALQRRFPGS